MNHNLHIPGQHNWEPVDYSVSEGVAPEKILSSAKNIDLSFTTSPSLFPLPSLIYGAWVDEHQKQRLPGNQG